MPDTLNRSSNPALDQILGDIPTRECLSAAPDMDSEEAARVLQLAEIAGIPVVVDGGWAVDALLGWQTRPHTDLDLAINQQYLPRFLNILKRLEYQFAPTKDMWEHNFVLEDGAGHRIDIHSFVRNGMGQIVAGVEYPGDSFTGQGKIDSTPLTCLAPDWLVDSHLGYAFDQADFQDVNYLCNLFKLQMPPEYKDYADALLDGQPAGGWRLPERFRCVLPASERDYLEWINLLDDSNLTTLPQETQNKLHNLTEPAGAPPPNLAAFQQEGLRSGLLLRDQNRAIGAIAIARGKTDEPEHTWEIRQLTLKSGWERSSLFMFLLRGGLKAVSSARVEEKSGGNEAKILVSPVDDINRPRAALPERYDIGDIGYASFYARAGFRRAEPNPASRWVLNL